MSTFRSRRGGAPEQRIDVLRLTRRIGALGTGLTVATCLALCAIVENAVAPWLSGHRGAEATRPPAPAGELTEAVGAAVTKRLASTARTAYGPDRPAGGAPMPVVRVSDRDERRTWAFGATALPAPAGSAAVPEAALFLAHRTARTWSIGLAGTVRFRRFLAHAPATVLPVAERRALTRYAAGHSPGAATGLVLPWPAGSTWTFAGVSAGTLAFVRHDGVVRAAGSGRLFRLCAHGLVMIIHADGLATEYAQVEAKGIDDGAYVAKGAELGRVATTAPCRAGRARARLRFALRDVHGRLPVNGVRLGAWTLHTRKSRAWATCGSRRVDAGDPITNEVEPPASSPAAAASRAPSASPGSSDAPLPVPIGSPSAGLPSPEVLK